MRSPHPALPPLPRGFVPILALVQGLQAAAIDSMLPALGVIAQEFGVAEANHRQYVVTLFLLFSGLGALIPGVLADRFGRRPVLLGYLGGYLACTLAAALAQSFTMLLIARAIMGLTAAGMTVLPAAIVRDRYEGDGMARVQSLMVMVFMIVPMAAPIVGQVVLMIAGWRWIFGAMAAMALLLTTWIALCLPETLDPSHRRPLAPREVARNTLATLTHRPVFGYIFGIALTQGTLFSFIVSMQQLLGEHFGAGALFPFLFAMMALAMSTTSFINSRIVERFGARRVSHVGIFAWIAVAAIQLWLAARGGETLWQFVPLMTLNMCLVGFTTANFAAIAMQPFARNAGAAASTQALVRAAGGALIAAVIGQAYNGTAVPLASGLLAGSVLTLVLVLISERGRLFHRVHRPVA